MNKAQIFHVKSFLWHGHCPICNREIIPFANQAAGITDTINSDIERVFFDNIEKCDGKTFSLKCNICGYIMTFDKQILINGSNPRNI
ncbi:hypothetical protein [Bacteroides sp.]|uniref:hypothetical protein n=1 Tax=Bacteroides sp. TaxID=29523 RepID=UPI0026381131|nr:hypothetical protein [Bacteroides sp.]